MLNKFYKRMARYLPLGIDAKTTFGQLAVSMGIAVTFSLAAPVVILSQYDHLYYREGSKKILYEGMMMPMFGEIVPTWFVLFGAVLIGCVLTAVMYYLYHRQDSMSIYTMRRLPSRWELHIRCLTVPVVTALLAIVLAILLMALYYAFYCWLVPAECIVPGQIPFLISEMTGGIF